MEDSSTSPPDTGGLQDSAPSSTKSGDHQEKASQRNKNKQQRKDKGSKTEQDNVNEDEAINKVNNDTPIPSSEHNTPTRIEVSTIRQVTVAATMSRHPLLINLASGRMMQFHKNRSTSRTMIPIPLPLRLMIRSQKPLKTHLLCQRL
jgi:hypothetical protein